MEEKESFSANIGTDKKDFSYEGRNVIAFSCSSLLGIRTLYTRVNFFIRFFSHLKKAGVFFF